MDTGTVTDRGIVPATPLIPRIDRRCLAAGAAGRQPARRLFIRAVLGAGACRLARTRAGWRRWGSRPTSPSTRCVGCGRSRDWDVGWTWAAQRFLGEARVHQRAGHEDAAALSQHHAALAYHLAGMLVFDDPRKIRALRASASSLYARSLPLLRPAVRRVEVPWRTTHLPGLPGACRRTCQGPRRSSVMLNGTSTSKEETLLWSDAFLEQGLAVLALDWPGSGESSLHVPPTADCDDFMEGVIAAAPSEPAIDASRIGARRIQPGWRRRGPCRRQ